MDRAGGRQKLETAASFDICHEEQREREFINQVNKSKQLQNNDFSGGLSVEAIAHHAGRPEPKLLKVSSS